GMAPPLYWPFVSRIHESTRSSSRSSVARRLASSLQCEQSGLTRVRNASGFTISRESWRGSSAGVNSPTTKTKINKHNRIGPLLRDYPIPCKADHRDIIPNLITSDELFDAL